MYEQDITRKHRTAIVIAVDRSLSMKEFVDCDHVQTVTKAEAVAYAVNSVISELTVRATRDGEVRNYYDIAVVGYSEPLVERVAAGGSSVEFLLDADRTFVPVSDLARRKPPLKKFIVRRMGADGAVLEREESLRMWVEPSAAGGTPMYEAFWVIRNMLRDWCDNPANAGSFPPIVINITDGEASDCTAEELRDITHRIRELKTADGNVIVMNIHMRTAPEPVSLLFPTAGELEGCERYLRLLAECSSVMPETYNGLIEEFRGASHSEGARYLAVGYNISPEGMFAMLGIGSRSVVNIGNE